MPPNHPMPIWGNEKTMNMNPLILTNIQSSPYFKVNLFNLKTYHEVIDEIYYKVSHLEPWEKGSRKTAGQTGMCGGVRGVGAGGIVSSAFCLLYKLFTLKLTKKQVNGLITHADSPYIRGLGFMYIRYTQPPQDLWSWYEEYLDDDEEIDVKAGGGHTMTIGEMLRQWLVKLEWYSTLFPRIPVPIQKSIEQNLRAHPPQAPQSYAEEEEEGGVAEEGGAEREQPPVEEAGGFNDARRHGSSRRSPPRDVPRGNSRSSYQRSPYAPRSPRDDFARELERERERQRRDRERDGERPRQDDPGRDRYRSRSRDLDRGEKRWSSSRDYHRASSPSRADRRRSRSPDYRASASRDSHRGSHGRDQHASPRNGSRQGGRHDDRDRHEVRDRYEERDRQEVRDRHEDRDRRERDSFDRHGRRDRSRSRDRHAREERPDRPSHREREDGDRHEKHARKEHSHSSSKERHGDVDRYDKSSHRDRHRSPSPERRDRGDKRDRHHPEEEVGGQKERTGDREGSSHKRSSREHSSSSHKRSHKDKGSDGHKSHKHKHKHRSVERNGS